MCGRVRALTELPKGCELRRAYVEVGMPTDARRERLRYEYGFECNCKRCEGCAELEAALAGRPYAPSVKIWPKQPEKKPEAKPPAAKPAKPAAKPGAKKPQKPRRTSKPAASSAEFLRNAARSSKPKESS